MKFFTGVLIMVQCLSAMDEDEYEIAKFEDFSKAMAKSLAATAQVATSYYNTVEDPLSMRNKLTAKFDCQRVQDKCAMFFAAEICNHSMNQLYNFKIELLDKFYSRQVRIRNIEKNIRDTYEQYIAYLSNGVEVRAHYYTAGNFANEFSCYLDAPIKDNNNQRDVLTIPLDKNDFPDLKNEYPNF